MEEQNNNNKTQTNHQTAPRVSKNKWHMYQLIVLLFLPSTEFIIPDVLDIKCGICELLVFCGCGKKTTNTNETNKKWAKTT